jgi:hypothetical protein
MDRGDRDKRYVDQAPVPSDRRCAEEPEAVGASDGTRPERPVAAASDTGQPDEQAVPVTASEPAAEPHRE